MFRARHIERLASRFASFSLAIISASATAQVVSPEATSTVLPAGAKVPAWAVPQSTPAPRPDPTPSKGGAEKTDDIQSETIYDQTPPARRLTRGMMVNDTEGVPSGAIVSAGTQLAIVMVGPYKIQVPINAVRGDGSLTIGATPADIENLLAASTRFQAETAKLPSKAKTAKTDSP